MSKNKLPLRQPPWLSEPILNLAEITCGLGKSVAMTKLCKYIFNNRVCQTPCDLETGE